MTATACQNAGPAAPGSASTDAASPSPTATPTPTPDLTPTPIDSPTDSATVTPTPEGPVRNPDLDDDLIAAAWDDDVAAARRLIEAGADVNAADDTEQSAFLIAASEGHTELLDLTLAHGADVTALDSYRGTALIRAAERGHADIVGRLIRAGVAIDHVNRLGWVALHEALVFAYRGPSDNRGGPVDYVDTVRVLVAAGADVTVRAERDGRSPVELATANRLAAQAELLGQAVDAAKSDQADVDQAGVDQAGVDRRLLDAAERGDADAAAVALRQGADLEAHNDHQQTPLLLASANDHADVARLLVHMGADPDAVDYRSDTPWLVTGVTGSVEMLEILLAADPDLTFTNRFGGLSPIPAAERGHVDYIRRVVSTGVDLDHVNDLGWTALLEAVILGDGGPAHQEVVRILVDAGVDTTIPDHDGVTARQHALNRGYDEIAALLG